MSYEQLRGRVAPELREAVNTLRDGLGRLSEKDQSFAKSLLESWDTRGLSDKQAYWVGELAKRAQVAAAPKVVIDLTRIHGLFNSAYSAGLQHPKLLVRTPNGDIRLTVNQGGQNVGQISVTSRGSFEDRDYWGRIDKAGVFHPHHKTAEHRVKNITEALQLFAKDPRAAAEAYGKATGACCFCGRHLTDERSVTAGYGPVCAEKWGLAWGEVGETGTITEAEAVAKLDAQRPILGVPDNEFFAPKAQQDAQPVDLRIALRDKLIPIHPEFGTWVDARIAEGWSLDQITDRLEQLFKVAEGRRQIGLDEPEDPPDSRDRWYEDGGDEIPF